MKPALLRGTTLLLLPGLLLDPSWGQVFTSRTATQPPPFRSIAAQQAFATLPRWLPPFRWRTPAGQKNLIQETRVPSPSSPDSSARFRLETILPTDSAAMVRLLAALGQLLKEEQHHAFQADLKTYTTLHLRTLRFLIRMQVRLMQLLDNTYPDLPLAFFTAWSLDGTALYGVRILLQTKHQQGLNYPVEDEIVVRSDLQRRGIAQQLLLASFQWMQATGYRRGITAIDDDNIPSLRMFERIEKSHGLKFVHDPQQDLPAGPFIRRIFTYQIPESWKPNLSQLHMPGFIGFFIALTWGFDPLQITIYIIGIVLGVSALYWVVEKLRNAANDHFSTGAPKEEKLQSEVPTPPRPAVEVKARPASAAPDPVAAVKKPDTKKPKIDFRSLRNDWNNAINAFLKQPTRRNYLAVLAMFPKLASVENKPYEMKRKRGDIREFKLRRIQIVSVKPEHRSDAGQRTELLRRRERVLPDNNTHITSKEKWQGATITTVDRIYPQEPDKAWVQLLTAEIRKTSTQVLLGAGGYGAVNFSQELGLLRDLLLAFTHCIQPTRTASPNTLDSPSAEATAGTTAIKPPTLQTCLQLTTDFLVAHTEIHRSLQALATAKLPPPGRNRVETLNRELHKLEGEVSVWRKLAPTQIARERMAQPLIDHLNAFSATLEAELVALQKDLQAHPQKENLLRHVQHARFFNFTTVEETADLRDWIKTYGSTAWAPKTIELLGGYQPLWTHFNVGLLYRFVFYALQLANFSPGRSLDLEVIRLNDETIRFRILLRAQKRNLQTLNASADVYDAVLRGSRSQIPGGTLRAGEPIAALRWLAEALHGHLEFFTGYLDNNEAIVSDIVITLPLAAFSAPAPVEDDPIVGTPLVLVPATLEAQDQTAHDERTPELSIESVPAPVAAPEPQPEAKPEIPRPSTTVTFEAGLEEFLQNPLASYGPVRQWFPLWVHDLTQVELSDEDLTAALAKYQEEFGAFERRVIVSRSAEHGRNADHLALRDRAQENQLIPLTHTERYLASDLEDWLIALRNRIAKTAISVKSALYQPRTETERTTLLAEFTDSLGAYQKGMEELRILRGAFAVTAVASGMELILMVTPHYDPVHVPVDLTLQEYVNGTRDTYNLRYHLVGVRNGEEALERLRHGSYAAVVIDLRENERNFLVEQIAKQYPDMPVVIRQAKMKEAWLADRIRGALSSAFQRRQLNPAIRPTATSPSSFDRSAWKEQIQSSAKEWSRLNWVQHPAQWVITLFELRTQVDQLLAGIDLDPTQRRRVERQNALLNAFADLVVLTLHPLNIVSRFSHSWDDDHIVELQVSEKENPVDVEIRVPKALPRSWVEMQFTYAEGFIGHIRMEVPKAGTTPTLSLRSSRPGRPASKDDLLLDQAELPAWSSSENFTAFVERFFQALAPKPSIPGGSSSDSTPPGPLLMSIVITALLLLQPIAHARNILPLGQKTTLTRTLDSAA